MAERFPDPDELLPPFEWRREDDSQEFDDVYGGRLPITAGTRYEDEYDDEPIAQPVAVVRRRDTRVSLPDYEQQYVDDEQDEIPHVVVSTTKRPATRQKPIRATHTRPATKSNKDTNPGSAKNLLVTGAFLVALTWGANTVYDAAGGTDGELFINYTEPANLLEAPIDDMQAIKSVADGVGKIIGILF